MPNRLAESPSLYLRQHATNPVDWFPWGEEAFQKAEAEGKPIFLSVGYASCHWCHVMAHESFEDEEVAEVLNEHFVSIKIDREERPDVDEAYMAAVQLATQRGGWPMTVFATPAGDPFFAGTYFPKQDYGSQPGFLSVVQGISEGWRTSRKEFEEAAEEFASTLRELSGKAPPSSTSGLHEGLLRGALGALHHDFDPSFAGFGGAPKFPPHTAIEFCLNMATRPGTAEADRELALHMAHSTLLAMACGGIRDHVGGGFHRYATDQHWGLPHFEKMLVDNALMLANYATAYRVTGFEPFQLVAHEIVGWLEREMKVDGLYASALDADTEGAEGLTYTWTWEEVQKTLGSDAVPFMEAYGFAMGGNFDDEATRQPTGRNIPMLEISEASLVEASRFSEAKSKLLEERTRRPQPARDDKALIGVNGMLIAGLALADHLDLAAALASNLCRFLMNDGKFEVPRYVVDGKAHGIGFLEDYAGVAYGLSVLSEADPEGDWGGAAYEVTREMVARFWNAESGSLYATSTDHQELFGRVRPVFDQPAPSATSLAVRCLLRHGYEDLAAKSLSGVAGWMERAPQATEALHTAYCELLELGIESTEPTIRHWLEWSSFPHRVDLCFALPAGWHLQEVSVDALRATAVAGQHVEAKHAIRIPVELSSLDQDASLRVRWQACSDDACLPWSEKDWAIGNQS